MSEEKKSEKKKSGGSVAGFFVIVLPLLAGLVVFIPAFLIFIVGMIPTICAYISDRTPDRSLSACVGAFNFLGVMVFVVQEMTQTASFHEVMATLQNPTTILVILSACGIGWLFYMIVPPIVAGGVNTKLRYDIRALEERQTALKEEWGDEVAAEQ